MTWVYGPNDNWLTFHETSACMKYLLPVIRTGRKPILFSSHPETELYTSTNSVLNDAQRHVKDWFDAVSVLFFLLGSSYPLSKMLHKTR